MPRTSREYLFGILVAALLLVGCSSSESLTDAIKVGRDRLPTERVVAPPDSLVHLTLSVDESGPVAQSRYSYEEILRYWSARPDYPTGYFARSLSPNNRVLRGAKARKFATLWSRELALAEAMRDSSETGHANRGGSDEIERWRQENRSVVRFDVHTFSFGPQPRINSRGDFLYSVLLTDGEGNKYRPDSIRTDPVISEIMPVQNTRIYYARNSIYFARTALEDRLGDRGELKLWLNSMSGETDESYSWLIRNRGPALANGSARQ